jgi:molecular chaperone GrpE
MKESSPNGNQGDHPTPDANEERVTTPESEDDVTLDASQDASEAEEPCATDESEIQRLERELATAHDAALRSHAELDNYRKRSFRELEEQRKYAGLPLMRDLLPVLDNLDRAIQAAEQSDSSSGLLEGVSMVAQHLHSVLDQHACKRIEAKGSAFDPNLHEAIGQLHCSDIPAGSVAEVTTVGYELHGRVVRPSQVFVSLGPAEEQPEDNEAE